jgi:hypothetical protein
MVVEDPQKKRVRPPGVGAKHAQRAVVKVKMPEGIDILALVTADLAALEAVLGLTGPGTVGGTASRPLAYLN